MTSEAATAGTEEVELEVSEKKKMRKKKSLLINLTHCRYDSVRRVARRCGLMPTVGESEEWTVYWMDTSVLVERAMDMKRYQKINHFPGMGEICRKDLLGRNLSRMKKLFPKDYNIFPQTWVMPADYSDFQAFCRLKKHKTFISKPEASCQGKGISIFKNPKSIKPGEHCVVQQYISRPFLIDGFKFDLRVYILVTSCDPLRVYVYKDGLGRFATIPYREPTHHNLEAVCLHLTNYSINKNSQDFVRDDLSGSKRRLSTVTQWFTDNGYNMDRIWASIEDVVIKTLVAAHPVLRHNYRSCFPSHTHGSACFEILGFDILLDHKLKAWLLEVNHSPSFHTDSPLDKEVKEGLLSDTLHMLDLRATDRRRCLEEDKKRAQQRLLSRHKTKEENCREEEERVKSVQRSQTYEERHMGGFRRIYPVGSREDDPYCKFFEQSSSLCAETAASKARMELVKMQREEIERKSKDDERMRARLGGVERRERGEEEGEVQDKQKNRHKVAIRRRFPFRLTSRKPEEPPGDTRSSSNPVENIRTTEQSVAEEDSGKTDTPIMAKEIQGSVVCEMIDEEEERERLAGLQIRERLVRNLDIPQTLSYLLASPQSPPPLPTSTLAGPPRTHSSTHHHITQSTPQPPPISLHSRHPLTIKSGPPYCCWQKSFMDPQEGFGLTVTAAHVASRLSHRY